MATAVTKSFRYTPEYLLRKIDATGNPKNTLIKSGAHLVLGVGAGTVATCIIGKWGFFAGLGLIGLGCYKDLSWAVPLGIGMSASALMLAKEETVQGVEGIDLNAAMSKAKERLVGLKDSFMDKTYMDKVFKPKTDKKAENKRISSSEQTSEDVNGLSEEPVSEEAIEEIEKQLVASAMEFQRKQNAESSRQMEGATCPDPMGFEEVDFSAM